MIVKCEDFRGDSPRWFLPISDFQWTFRHFVDLRMDCLFGMDFIRTIISLFIPHHILIIYKVGRHRKTENGPFP